MSRTLTAADLIGRPYARGAGGPEAFDCWGLVRFYFRAFRGIEFPEIFVRQAEQRLANQQAIGEIAREVGWRPVDGSPRPRADDIVVLRSNVGRHVGVMVRDGSRVHLLHCEGTAENPLPGVLFEPLEQVLSRYTQPETWRHRP